MGDEFRLRDVSDIPTNPEEEDDAAVLAISGGHLQNPESTGTSTEESAHPSQPPTTFDLYQNLRGGHPTSSPTSEVGGDTDAQGWGLEAPPRGGIGDCHPTEASTPQLPGSTTDPGEGDFLSVHDKALEENRKLRDRVLCLICIDANRNVVLFPCGHVAVCSGCADQCARPPHGRCPVCRTLVSEIYPILLSTFMGPGRNVTIGSDA